MLLAMLILGVVFRCWHRWGEGRGIVLGPDCPRHGWAYGMGDEQIANQCLEIYQFDQIVPCVNHWSGARRAVLAFLPLLIPLDRHIDI